MGLNPSTIYWMDFFSSICCKIVMLFEKTKINEKEAGDSLFKKKHFWGLITYSSNIGRMSILKIGPMHAGKLNCYTYCEVQTFPMPDPIQKFSSIELWYAGIKLWYAGIKLWYAGIKLWHADIVCSDWFENLQQPIGMLKSSVLYNFDENYL